MTWKQKALLHLMSRISEDAYCAGWMEDNEYVLWRMVADPEADRTYGMRKVSKDDINDLRKISKEIGGWIRWSEERKTEVFVPMAEWLVIYRKHQEQHK